MAYLPLDNYSRKWIFSHSSMPVPQTDLEFIKPMDALRSSQLWMENISRHSPDAERFSSEDWPAKNSNWVLECDWMEQWESEDNTLPEEIASFIQWQDDVTVYFCYEKYNVIETKWAVFKRNWKNFLFFDDGPILIGRRRDEALWFSDDGKVRLGKRK